MGNLELMFPAFSRSKVFTVQADIVIVPESEDPMFNLILGIDTLAKFGTVLNFKDKTVEINQAKISMRPLKDMRYKINLKSMFSC